MNNLTPTERDWNRFWVKVQKTDSCWIWTAAKNRAGYGQFGFGPKLHTKSATRFIVTFVKKIQLSDNDVVCHSCDNPSCVNPDHLWVGSQLDNMRDAKNKNRMFTGSRTITCADDINYIRKYYQDSTSKRQALADLTKKYQSTISSIQGIIYQKK